MDEMQAFYDAFFPRAEEAIAYCDQFPLDDMPDDARAAAAAAVLARHGVVPGGGVAPAARPRFRRGVPRPPDRADPVSDSDRPARGPLGRRRRGRGAVARGHRRRRRPHRGGRTRPSCRAARPRSTSATSRCCPGSWTWSSTCSWAGRAAGTSAATSRTIPRSARCAARSNCRTTLLAGFTTARNLGLFVKTGGYLLDVALARAIDNGWIDGPRLVPAGPRDHADRRPPRPDDVPAARPRHHAAERRGGHRQRRARGAQGGPLPDQVRRAAHQDLRVGRRDVAQRARGRAAVLRRGARRDRRRSAPRRA